MGRSNAARAGPSQSQSQSQRPTQTQRRGRRVEEVPEEEEEEEQEEEEEEGDDQMDMDGTSEISQKANDLVRLALFMEHKRSVLRRDDINKKILGQNSRSFNLVFTLAQQKLHDAFGMELVELPSRAGLEQGEAPEETQENGRVATGLKKKAAATGSKTYMVRSLLDPLIIEYASQTDPKILEEEGGDQGTLFPSTLEDEDDDDDDGDQPPKFYGSVISWSRADQLGSIGILYVILALVLVNGKVITDADLRRHLKTLHLPSNPAVLPVKFNASSTVRSMNLDAFLSNLLKQGYLDRELIGADAGRKGKKGGAGSKRLRTQAEDLEEGRTYEWRWGPRAHTEVGEQNIGGFVAEFMVETDMNEDDEEGGGAARGATSAAARKKQEETVKKMYSGIEKAAGGHLAEIK